MERLTYVKHPKTWGTGRHPTKYTSRKTFQEVVGRLAYYEDMEEQGRLKILPCAVGDMVWDKEVEPWNVISVEWFSRKVTHLHCVSPVTGRRGTFALGKRSLGKTVFLTREEAEKALRGGADNA